MGRVLVYNRDIVIPGDILAEGEEFTPREGAIRLGEKIVSTVVGVVYIENKTVRVIPLEGEYYQPKNNDLVIGKIVDYSATSWSVDIRAPYLARLELAHYLEKPEKVERIKDLRMYLDIGDVIQAKILNADRTTNPILTTRDIKRKKLEGGLLIYITPKRVRRVVGKNQSMLNMIKELTKSEIIVGANGIIWINSDNPEVIKIVSEAIKKIERESFTSKLTERIRRFIEDKMREII